MQENTLHIAGYLAAAPTVRYTSKGTPVANARIGQTSRSNKEDGSHSEHTNWFNLVFWGPVAQALAAADVKKGANLWAEGTLEQRQFARSENPENKSTIYEVNVRKFFLIVPINIENDEREEQTGSTTETQPSAAPAHDSDSTERWPI